MDTSLTPLRKLFTHLILDLFYLFFGGVDVSCFDCLVPIPYGKFKTCGIWLASLLWPLHRPATMDAQHFKSYADTLLIYIKYVAQILLSHVLVGGMVTFYHRHEDPWFALLTFIASDVFVIIPATGVLSVENNKCGFFLYVAWCYAWALIIQDIRKSAETYSIIDL
jgi:hypothetical protein